MSSLVSVAFLLYFAKVLSVPRTCTVNDICLPVHADVCDNSRCLLVNQSEIDEFRSHGFKPYKWNIGMLSFAESCSIMYNYETSVAYDGTVTTYSTFNITSGSSCNESSTLKFVTEQCDTGGRFTLTKRLTSNATFEECYLYFEPGVAFVARACLVEPSYLYGQACVAIYAEASAKAIPDVYGQMGKLDDFLESLDIDLQKINSDCSGSL